MSKHYWIFALVRKMLFAFVSGFLVTELVFAGQESTIFSYDGHDFLRTKTTLTTEDGKSAVNTKLDRKSPAYKELVDKRSYTGETFVFGQRCDANYAPLTNAKGELTGALFVANCKK